MQYFPLTIYVRRNCALLLLFKLNKQIVSAEFSDIFNFFHNLEFSLCERDHSLIAIYIYFDNLLIASDR